MRSLILLFPAFLSACVATGGPDPISAALVGRSVDYDSDWDGPMADHEVQSWTADGRTEIANYYNITTRDVAGQWKVENGRYCEKFDGRSHWTCLRVTLLEGGLVRFKEYPKDFGELIIPLFNEDRIGKFLPD